MHKQNENDRWPNLLAVLLFQINVFFLALEAFLTGIGIEGHPVDYPVIRGALLLIAHAIWALELFYRISDSASDKKALGKHAVFSIGGTLGYTILFYAAVFFSLSCAILCCIEIRDCIITRIDQLLSPLYTFGASWFTRVLLDFNDSELIAQVLKLAAVFIPGFLFVGFLKWSWDWIHRENEKLQEVYPGVSGVFGNELLIPQLHGSFWQGLPFCLCS